MHRRRLRELTLVLTTRCNLGCAYCFQAPRAPADMSAAVLRRAVASALAAAPRRLRVAVTGGEPLLARERLAELLALAAAARRAGRAVELTVFTNGTLLDAAARADLVAGDVALQISHDGVPAAGDHPGEGTVALLDRHLRALRREAPRHWRRRVRVATVFTPHTLPRLAEAVAHLLALDVPRLTLTPAAGAGDDWGPAACAELERQLDLVAALCRAHRTRTGRQPVTCLQAPARAGARKPVTATGTPGCAAFDGATLTVDVDGSVHGCASLTRLRAPAAWLAPTADALRAGHVGGDELAVLQAALDRRARPAGRRFARDGRRSLRRDCGACALRDDCLVCPLALHPGADGALHVPDAHCLFRRRTHALACELARDDPLEPLRRRAAGA